MTPEKAEAILQAMAASMDTWIDELQSFVHKCPEAQHLLAQMKQSRTSLVQLVERDSETGQ